MTAFTARWITRADPYQQRIVCGRPDVLGGGRCAGKLGWALYLDGVGWRLSHTEGHYYQDGPNRYRLGFRDRDANGKPHRYAGRPGRRPHPLGLDPADDAVLGQAPVAPTTIVCPICGRDNDVPNRDAPASGA